VSVPQALGLDTVGGAIGGHRTYPLGGELASVVTLVHIDVDHDAAVILAQQLKPGRCRGSRESISVPGEPDHDDDDDDDDDYGVGDAVVLLLSMIMMIV
jgi:hypothetical protein